MGSNLESRYRTLASSYDSFYSALSPAEIYLKLQDKDMPAPKDWDTAGPKTEFSSALQVSEGFTISPGDSLCFPSGNMRMVGTVRATQEQGNAKLIQLMHTDALKTRLA